jgi:hypothetical protein
MNRSRWNSRLPSSPPTARSQLWLGVLGAWGQFGAGCVHCQFDDALAGQLMQLAQALEREPVEQGDKPQGEVAPLAFLTGSVARYGLRDMYPEEEQC